MKVSLKTLRTKLEKGVDRFRGEFYFVEPTPEEIRKQVMALAWNDEQVLLNQQVLNEQVGGSSSSSKASPRTKSATSPEAMDKDHFLSPRGAGSSTKNLNSASTVPRKVPVNAQIPVVKIQADEQTSEARSLC